MLETVNKEIEAKKKERKNNIGYYSGKMSDLVRQLSFAGIAIIWLFKENGQNGSIILAKSLLVSLVCIVVSILCELIHFYMSAEKNNYYYYRPDQKLPNWNKRLNWWLWRIKSLLVFIAYVSIGYYVINKLYFSFD